jgi:mono/diheme cytochrome c family protein
MRPRVLCDQIEVVRAVTDPFPAGEEIIAKGKALYGEKAFCRACHGVEGKGLGGDSAPGTLKGPYRKISPTRSSTQLEPTGNCSGF